MKDKREIRDLLRLIGALLFCWRYVPHYLLYASNRQLRKAINNDLDRRNKSLKYKWGYVIWLLYYLHIDRYFRNLFYHRAGAIVSALIHWCCPGDRYFVISKTTELGEGAYFAHPFATEINAKSIGKNFSCRHLTTIGNKHDGDNENRPVIGDNVTLGVNVTIIGNVKIGNNVVIGAGSVVVKDIPNNCVAVGNPCKPIKYIQ